MESFYNRTVPSAIILITGILISTCCGPAYAQLADTMLCADKSCSKTISEGEARLAYRPRDEKFLNLKKGDVVLVKSKNAGKKTHLWGGEVMGSNQFGFFPSSFIREYLILEPKPVISVSVQDFLKEKITPRPEDPYSRLVGENQKRVDKENPTDRKKNLEELASEETKIDDKEEYRENKVKNEHEKLSQDEGNIHKQRSKRDLDNFENEKPSEEKNEKSETTKNSLDNKINSADDSKKIVMVKEDETNGKDLIAETLVEADKLKADSDKNSDEVRSEKTKADITGENAPEDFPADIAVLLGGINKEGILQQRRQEKSPSEKKDNGLETMKKSDDHDAEDKSDDEANTEPESSEHTPTAFQKDVDGSISESEPSGVTGSSTQPSKIVTDDLNEVVKKDSTAEVATNSDEQNGTYSEEISDKEIKQIPEDSHSETQTADQPSVKKPSDMLQKPPQDGDGNNQERANTDESKSLKEVTGNISKSAESAPGDQNNNSGEIVSKDSSIEVDPKKNGDVVSKDSSIEVDPKNDGEVVSKDSSIEVDPKNNGEVVSKDSSIEVDAKNDNQDDSFSEETNSDSKDPQILSQVADNPISEKDPSDKLHNEMQHQDNDEINSKRLSSSEAQDQTHSATATTAQLSEDLAQDKPEADPKSVNLATDDEKTDSNNTNKLLKNQKVIDQNADANESQPKLQDDTKAKKESIEQLEDSNSNSVVGQTPEVEESHQTPPLENMKQDELDGNVVAPNEIESVLVQTADLFSSTIHEEDSDGVVVETASNMDNEELEQSPHLKKEVNIPEDSKKVARHETELNQIEVDNSSSTETRKDESLSENQNETEWDGETVENPDDKKVKKLVSEDVDIKDNSLPESDNKKIDSQPQVDLNKISGNTDEQFRRGQVPVNSENTDKITHTADEHKTSEEREKKDENKDSPNLNERKDVDHGDHQALVDEKVKQQDSQHVGDSVDDADDKTTNDGSSKQIHGDEANNIQNNSNIEKKESTEIIPGDIDSVSATSDSAPQTDEHVTEPIENQKEEKVVGDDSLKIENIIQESETQESITNSDVDNGDRKLGEDAPASDSEMPAKHIETPGAMTTDCGDDQLLKWFYITNKEIGASKISEDEEEEDALDEDVFIYDTAYLTDEDENNEGLTKDFESDQCLNVIDDPLLLRTMLVKFVRCNQDRTTDIKEIVEESSVHDPTGEYDEMSTRGLEGVQCLNVVDHPLLLQTIPVKFVRRKQDWSTDNNGIVKESSVKDLTDEYDEMSTNDFEGDQCLNVIDNPLLLQTMLVNFVRCKEFWSTDNNEIVREGFVDKSPESDSTEGLNGFSSYMSDPKLKWVLSNAKFKSNLKLSEIPLLESIKQCSSYRKHPMLKWVLLKSDICRAFTTSPYSQGCSSYRDDPILKWVLLKGDKCNVRPTTPTVNVASILQDKDLQSGEIEIFTEDLTSNNIEIDETCSSYFNDPILKWILPGNAKCEQEQKHVIVESVVLNMSDDDEKLVAVTIDKVGETESSKEHSHLHEHFNPTDSLNAEVVTAVMVDGDTLHGSGQQYDIYKDETKDKDTESVPNVSTKTLDSTESSSSVWMMLRHLLNAFQDSYEDTVTFRVGVADIVRDMKILKRSKPEVTARLHTSAKSLRRNVIALENDILLHIQTLTRLVHGAGMLKENHKDTENNFIPKHESILSITVAKIKRMENDISLLHREITEQMYENIELMDEFGEIEEEKKTTHEITRLQEQLLELDKKMSVKDTESSSLMQKMEKEADMLTDRIAELEESLIKKREDEILHAAQSEEQKTKLEEKLAALQTTISEKNEKQLEIAKEQNTLMNEKLQKLETSLKLTAETDKPFVERITFLEEELSSRKRQEIESTKKDKFEATLLRSKIQALERQLRKKQHHGNHVMLHEAQALKENIRKLENNLSEKAIKEEHDLKGKGNDGEITERISSLEKELKKQTKFVSLVGNNSETNDLKARVEAMEKRLRVQVEKLDGSKNKPISIGPMKDFAKVKYSKKLTQEQIMEVLNDWFLQKDKSTSHIPVPLYRNQTEQIAIITDEKDLETINSDIDFKCIVNPAKRKACGAKQFSKDYCNALQCCWHPVDDSSIPPCYFSLLQLANPNNKEIYEPELDDVKEEISDQYNALHEGKVVNWDETIEEKVAKEKAVGWDESLESSNEVTQSADNQRSLEELVVEENSEKEKIDDLIDESQVASTLSVDNQINTPNPNETFTSQPVPVGNNETAKETEIQSNDAGSFVSDTPAEHTESEIGAADNKTSANVKDTVNAQENTEFGEDAEKNVETEDELHIESFWLRLMLSISKFPSDVLYVMEPLFNVWVSLLPDEYQNDVHGISWTIIALTLFIGFATAWLLICRSKAANRKRHEEHSQQTIRELKSQLENISQEKISAENELKTNQDEIEIQREEMANATQLKDEATRKHLYLDQSLRENISENNALKQDITRLTQSLQERDQDMQEVLSNSQHVEKSLLAQQEAIARYEENIAQLQASVSEHEGQKKTIVSSTEKLKERMKNLEKSKGETKKEGKILKDQIDKLNTKIGELQERLDSELEDGESKTHEIDILKDCILQFKGAQEYLAEDSEDMDSEQAVENQKEKLKSLIDVANVKSTLKQIEAEKLRVTYELEAEQKSRMNTEGKLSELEATIQTNDAIHNKLGREKQLLESKLSVMQEFYAKREVEIQSKLGLEQSKRENNTTLLEGQQQQQLELLQQLDAYKKMSEEAKRKYEESDRQHKQEVLGFEKKSHDNWLTCRDTERKHEEATKQINQLHLELSDARHRLHDREPIFRPRPERHGPPGAPPPFGPPRKPPPHGLPGSPLHFRTGPPPDMGRRTPPPQRRPPSPGGSIPGDRPPSRPDRPPSRPDRPPSAHSLPPMDRRPPPGPPFSNTPGREFRPYRDGMPPERPPNRDMPPQGRPGPGQRAPGGPMNSSSPYMERPPIPPSQSSGIRSQNYTQSTLHATPPQTRGDGLRNDRYPPPPPNAADRPPPGMESRPGNPFYARP